MEYNDALAQLERTDHALAHDDPLTAQARAGFDGLFEPFTPDAMRESVRAVYAEDVFFNDTLKTIRDRETLAAYLAQTASGVEDCRISADEWIRAATGWYVRWRMTIRFKQFKRGTDTHSIGISHIVFDRDGHIALHQDFWDAAGGFYEHIPLVGGLLRRIRNRL